MSEIWDEGTISMSKFMYVLLLLESKHDKVTPLHPVIQSPLNEFSNEVYHSVISLGDYQMPF